ncbi:MAG: suppressor of fused domain protein [Treponema sp.]|nr:suppressor of fused domain protein [Treponema sp.]MCL2251837.1 suppressor of fused domain protein [Treponema sp.]
MDISESHKIVDAHLLKYLNNDEFMVFHEKESELFHLDIYWIKPNENRSYNLLLTNGISSLAMNTPDKSLTKNIELCILLPPDWVSENDWKNPEKNWPITLLSSIGRYPFQNNTWLGFSHTIETGYLLPGTNFEGIMLLKSTMLPVDFQKINYGENNIEIYTVFPLYMNELIFVRNNGLKDLLELFDKEKFNDIVNINRKNVCNK